MLHKIKCVKLDVLVLNLGFHLYKIVFSANNFIRMFKIKRILFFMDKKFKWVSFIWTFLVLILINRMLFERMRFIIIEHIDRDVCCSDFSIWRILWTYNIMRKFIDDSIMIRCLMIYIINLWIFLNIVHPK